MVKAYPALSKTYGEVSCIAGVEMLSTGPRWIRLYPVPFRALDDSRQFAKYQPMRVRVETHWGDRRPEHDDVAELNHGKHPQPAIAAKEAFASGANVGLSVIR